MSVERTKPSIAALIAGMASVFKSLPDDKTEDLKDVLDMWNEPGGEHKNPGRNEIVTGPAERMSGDGLPKMIAEYSQVAPQQGLTEQYQQFQRIMPELTKALHRVDRLEKALNALLGTLQKAAADEAAAAAARSAAPSEDTFLGKSMLKLAKAKGALRKADLADEGEIDVRKSHLAEASDLLKSAKRLLAKASEEMEDTDDAGCEKALSTLRSLTKAVAKAEEEDKEKEAAEKALVAKSEEEAKKKIEEAKKDGEKEKEAEKEAAEAAKAKEIADAVAKALADRDEQIKKALEGNAALKTGLAQVMDMVAGKSQNPGGAPEITKGTVVPMVDYAQRVQDAIDNDQLSDANITKAQSLVQYMHQAKAGNVDQRIVDAQIAKAPAEVRALFQAAA